MNPYAKLLLLISIFIVSAYLVWAWQKYLRLRNYLDNPNPRSMHKIPTPRGGGIGIYIAFHMGIIIYWIITDTFSDKNYYILIGSFLVASIGLLDDLFHIRRRIRILVHFISAIIAYFWLSSEFKTWLIENGFPNFLHPWIQFLWILGLVYSINLFNFMDGINGLAGMETVFVAGSFAIFLSDVYYLEYRSLQIGLLAFAALGFLIWNFPKAVVFLGDCGSGFLGYILFAVGSWMVFNNCIQLVSFLLITLVFWMDATLTILFRLIHRENIFEPHTKHLYQVLAIKWKSHAWVTILYSLINVLFLFPIVYWIESGSNYTWRLLFISMALFTLFYYRIQNKEGTFHVTRAAT